MRSDYQIHLTQPLALALEGVTGVPSRLWNMYESGYRNALARESAGADLEAQYQQAKEFPLSYLRKWGFITVRARERAETIRQLLGVLGVASLEAFHGTWTRGSVALSPGRCRAQGCTSARRLVGVG